MSIVSDKLRKLINVNAKGRVQEACSKSSIKVVKESEG
jgi:hypothetical protein